MVWIALRVLHQVTCHHCSTVTSECVWNCRGKSYAWVDWKKLSVMLNSSLNVLSMTCEWSKISLRVSSLNKQIDTDSGHWKAGPRSCLYCALNGVIRWQLQLRVDVCFHHRSLTLLSAQCCDCHQHTTHRHIRYCWENYPERGTDCIVYCRPLTHSPLHCGLEALTRWHLCSIRSSVTYHALWLGPTHGINHNV